MRLSITLLFLALAFDASAQPKNFWKVNDTLNVRGPAVVGYMMPDTMMERLWREAKTAEDSDGVNTAMDDFGWHMGTCRELLDSLKIANTFDEARYIRAIGAHSSVLIDRQHFPPDHDEDIVLINRSGEWMRKPDLLLGDSAAIAQTRQFLRMR